MSYQLTQDYMSIENPIRKDWTKAENNIYDMLYSEYEKSRDDKPQSFGEFLSTSERSVKLDLELFFTQEPTEAVRFNFIDYIIPYHSTQDYLEIESPIRKDWMQMENKLYDAWYSAYKRSFINDPESFVEYLSGMKTSSLHPKYDLFPEHTLNSGFIEQFMGKLVD